MRVSRGDVELINLRVIAQMTFVELDGVSVDVRLPEIASAQSPLQRVRELAGTVGQSVSRSLRGCAQ